MKYIYLHSIPENIAEHFSSIEAGEPFPGLRPYTVSMKFGMRSKADILKILQSNNLSQEEVMYVERDVEAELRALATAREASTGK